VQSGSRNDNFIEQRAGATNNRVDVTQSGTGNAARTVQVGQRIRPTVASGNTVKLNQSGSNNYSGTAQEGSGNLADIKVSGAGVSVAGRQSTGAGYRDNEPPETDVWQVSDNNKAYIDQASDASSVTIYQGFEQTSAGYPLALGGNNLAKVTQTASADRSRADVIQGGSDHIADVVQSGADNQSYVNQLGLANIANVTQASAGNLSFVNQTGTGNVAVVKQGN
jgi:hypothetical protein